MGNKKLVVILLCVVIVIIGVVLLIIWYKSPSNISLNLMQRPLNNTQTSVTVVVDSGSVKTTILQERDVILLDPNEPIVKLLKNTQLAYPTKNLQ